MTTVGKYLATRLSQAGLKHIFGVPGDYVLEFFKCLEQSPAKVVCTTNELAAGYAADAYARLTGLGAVCVTYGVGGFSLFNAVVGAFAERLPLVAISGGPSVTEHNHHHLLHHTVGDMNLQYNIYEKITAASVILMNPEEAPKQIDNTLAACLRLKRPVYIEIPVDMVAKPCRAPGPFKPDTAIYTNREALAEAVDDAAEILNTAKSPVILAGVEAHRLGAQAELEKLVGHTGYPFATTLLGKSVLPESHPQFVGVYGGVASWKGAQETFERADIILSLGALMTDIHVGRQKTLLDASKMIVANSDNVRIKHHHYSQISLKDFLNGLRAKLPKGRPPLAKIRHPSEVMKEKFTPLPRQKITVKRFYQRINRFIASDHVLLADAGDSLFSASHLFLPQGTFFIDQAFYLSIGYSVPATLGAKLAAPRRRPVTFVGDGAFQTTGQELSTIIRQKLNPIIFLMNNDGYTIERVMVDGAFNDLNMWKYHRLPEIYGGGWGCQVSTEGELEKALAKIKSRPDELAFIEVILDRWDCSDGIRKYGKAYRAQF